MLIIAISFNTIVRGFTYVNITIINETTHIICAIHIVQILLEFYVWESKISEK